MRQMGLWRALLPMAAMWLLSQTPEGARVLAVFPVPMRSHWIVCCSLLEALHDRGHQLTVLTPYPAEKPRLNWTEIVVPDTMHLLGGESTARASSNVRGTDDLFSLGQRSDFIWLLRLFNYGIASCDVFLQQESVRQLFESDREFDVIVIETFFNDCLMALADRFRAPVVAISTLAGTVWMSDMVGSPYPLAHAAEPFLSYTDRMAFWERAHNAAFATFARAVRRFYYAPQQDALLRMRLGDPRLPGVLALERNTSLLLLNSHPSLHAPRPLAPNVVEVGGMHVGPARPLPLNLQEFIDNATDGAILFSLGSNIKSSQMPEEKRAAFLAAFSQLKQRVLWKWETEDLPGQPENLKVAKWLPQSDILAHKNVRLFITHGGLGSTLEAVHHGVPLIGVPVFADQDSNMVRAEQGGYGLRLQFANITADSLLWAITEVLENPRYREEARRLSQLFADRPVPALESAVFWTEYVARHGGAAHLRSPALSLSWWQLWLLDVLAAAAAGLALLAVAAMWTARRLAAALRRALTARSKKHL